MNFLEERILRDATVCPGDILNVNAFLHHQIDMKLIDQIALEMYERFRDRPINKILTIEVSGISIACSVARLFNVPLVYAKKTRSKYQPKDVYEAEVLSFRHKNINTIVVGKEYLTEADHVLIVDDIMADGFALQGLISIVEDAEATVEGCAIAIEKGFQEGGDRIRNLGYRVESLVTIDGMEPHSGTIVFRPE